MVWGPEDGSWASHTPSGDVIVLDIQDSSSMGVAVETLVVAKADVRNPWQP